MIAIILVFYFTQLASAWGNASDNTGKVYQIEDLTSSNLGRDAIGQWEPFGNPNGWRAAWSS